MRKPNYKVGIHRNRHCDPGHLRGEHPHGKISPVVRPCGHAEESSKETPPSANPSPWQNGHGPEHGQHQMPAGHGAMGPLASDCWKCGKARLCRKGPAVSSKTSQALGVRSSGHTPRHLPQDLTTCVRVTPAHRCSQGRYPQLPELRHDWGALESGMDAQTMGRADGGW